MGFSTEIRENRAFAAEIKYLVPADRVDELRCRARALLRPDPFGGGPHGDTYVINSLYFDTREFDVFHRRGSYGRSKYRARRYGDSRELFLERKLKTHDQVTKRRSIVGIAELPRLAAAETQKGWAGHWFHRRILARDLGPVCQVQYHRTALVHANGHGPIRLTLDVDLRAAGVSGLEFQSLAEGPRLTGRDAILELKYYRAAPPMFEDLVEQFALTAQPISKYRIGARALEFVEVPV